MPATSRRQRRYRSRRAHGPVQPPSLYPRPQYAAWGMAPAGGLVAPSLEGVVTEYVAMTGDGLAVALARTLLEIGVGHAADWTACGRTANVFVQATFARLYAEHGGARIRQVFDIFGSIGRDPDGYVRPRSLTDSLTADTCHITAFPGSAAPIVLGPTLDRIERVSGKLAATFYSLLTDVLCRIGRPFGYHDAEGYLEMLRDGIDPEEADQYEYPDVESCARPAFTEQPYRSPRQITRALARCDDTEVTAWVRQAMALAALPHIGERVGSPDDLDEYYDGEPVPFVLLATREGDAIYACFDHQCQYWGETSGLPMFSASFTVTDHDAVRRAVAGYTRWLDLLDGASAFLATLPGNDFSPAPAPPAADDLFPYDASRAREYA